jgi:hypothetical protein
MKGPPTLGFWAEIEGSSRSGTFLTELSRRRCVPDRPDTRVSQVLSALKSDGHGGTVLSFGKNSSLDFTGIAPPQLHESNFQIG